MSVLTKGDNTVIFGTTTFTSAFSTLGYVQSVRKNPTNNEAQVIGPDGEPVAETLYGDKIEYTVELVLISSGTIPAKGDAITVNGDVCYLPKPPDQAWSNTGYCSLTLIARRYKNFPTP